MPLEVVRRGWDVEIVDCPPMVQLTPNVVRHHTTHGRPSVCIECSRAVSPEQVATREVSGVVCTDCSQ